MSRKRQPKPRRFLVQTVLPKEVWSKAWKVVDGSGHSMSSWLRHLVATAVKRSEA
jgi:hypothetical protein